MIEKCPIDTEYIELAQLLKLMNLVETGGEAKTVIQDGLVSVNGQIETRRGRKLQPGDRVRLGDNRIEVTGA